MLKTQIITVSGQTVILSAISALDYLSYVEYMNEQEKPEPVAESDNAQDLNRKLNQINRVNLLVNTRLIALSLARAQPEKNVQEWQDDLLNNWTHADILVLLGTVQDVCDFPAVETSDNGESEETGDPKNA